jgi:hypothetical protein
MKVLHTIFPMSVCLKKKLTPCCDLTKHITCPSFLFCLLHLNFQIATTSNPPGNNWFVPQVNTFVVPTHKYSFPTPNALLICRNKTTWAGFHNAKQIAPQSSYFSTIDQNSDSQNIPICMICDVVLVYVLIRVQGDQWVRRKPSFLSCSLCLESIGFVVIIQSATPSRSCACLPSMITFCGEFWPLFWVILQSEANQVYSLAFTDSTK